MRIVEPKPFTFKQEERKRAVLLLHGFTGNTADVRRIGRFLSKKGYTSHAPLYRGHGKSPEELLQYTPEEWLEDAKEGYHYLKQLGYEKIAAIGLSLGGIFSLHLAIHEDIVGVVPMCTPMFFDNEKQLTEGFTLFSKEYKQLQRKTEEQIEQEIKAIFTIAPNTFAEIGQIMNEVRTNLSKINSPIKVVQARLDEMINTDSAPHIYNNVSSVKKELAWYEKSGHAITFGPEREQLHEDIYQFLEGLDW